MERLNMDVSRQEVVQKYNEHVRALETRRLEKPPVTTDLQASNPIDSEVTLSKDQLIRMEEHLEVLRAKTLRFYTERLVPGDKESLNEYYGLLSDVRDYSIMCLNYAGKLMTSGKIDTFDDQIIHTIQTICPIEEKPQLEESTKDLSLLEKEDPFEYSRFTIEAQKAICSLATIPSGRTILQTLFDLRYYNPKLDKNRRQDVEYIPSTVEICNPMSAYFGGVGPLVPDPDIKHEGDPEAVIREGKISHGEYRKRIKAYMPMADFNKIMHIVIGNGTSDADPAEKLMQPMMAIQLGHELVHTIHHAYGVRTSKDNSLLTRVGDASPEEQITSGVLALEKSNSSRTLADALAYDNAEDSVKEAFLVSERTLRDEFSVERRESYKDTFKIDGSISDDKFAFLFASEMINVLLSSAYLSIIGLHDETLSEFLLSQKQVEHESLKQSLHNFLSSIESDKDRIMETTINLIFANLGSKIDENLKKRFLSRPLIRERLWLATQMLITYNIQSFACNMQQLITASAEDKNHDE